MNVIKGTAYITLLTVDKVKFHLKEIWYKSKYTKDAEAEMLRKHQEFEAKFMRMLEEARKEEAKIE